MPSSESFRACRGFSYIGILLAVALLGAGMAATGELWSLASQREKERELLFIGDEYRRAITSYYESTPGAAKRFPSRFEDLVRDPRFPVLRRHLRKLYADPMTGRTDWGIIPGPGGTIMGVYSLGGGIPAKRSGFPGLYRHFEKAESHSDWKFAYTALRASGTVGVVSAATAGTRSSAPQATGIPTAAIVGSGAVAPPRPKPREEETDPHKKNCGILQTNDAIACDAAAKKYGPSVGSQCQASAQQRYSQCVEYGPLPLLVITP